MKYSKPIVLLIIILNVGFVYYIGQLMRYLGFEPTSLIVAWFAFTTGELWLLAGIKKSKIKNQNRDC